MTSRPGSAPGRPPLFSGVSPSPLCSGASSGWAICLITRERSRRTGDSGPQEASSSPSPLVGEGVRGCGGSEVLAPLIVRSVAPPAQQTDAPQPAAPPGPPFRAEVETPEAKPIARRHTGDIGRIEELSEVLRLPDPPRPGVVRQTVKVDEVDTPPPGEQRGGVATGDVEVARIEVLLKPPTVVQQARQAGDFLQ